MELSTRVHHCGATFQKHLWLTFLQSGPWSGKGWGSLLPKSERHAWLSSFLLWKWCWIGIRWSRCLLLLCNFAREGDRPGRVITPGLPICAGDEAGTQPRALWSVLQAKKLLTSKLTLPLLSMPVRGTTLIKWGCLKLQWKSWGSDSDVFSMTSPCCGHSFFFPSD